MGISHVRGLIAATVARLGFDGPQPPVEVVLLRDGHHVGWRFEFDGVRAVWLLETEQIRFQDQDGKLLSTIKIAETDSWAA